MKKATLAIAAMAIALASAGALAQQKKEDMGSADMKGMDMKDMSKQPTPSKQVTHTAKGVVKKIDAASGMVTIAHEPVKTMNWSAMSMAFKVKDKAMLDKLSEGKKVEFDFAQQGNDYVINAVR